MSRHFVFVHGASHGAWCWYKVSNILQSAGHTVSTLDLAASGMNPKRVNEVNSLSDYAQPLMDFMESLVVLTSSSKVYLVGHSMAGASISLAMENYPSKIACAVFVAATMPGITSTTLAKSAKEKKLLDSHVHATSYFSSDTKYLYGEGPNNAPTAMLQGPNFLKNKYYRLSPAEDYVLGSTLWRYLPVKSQYLQDLVLTEKNYGSVYRVYVICDPENDVIWQEALISNNPPNEVFTIYNSDHMVMFSQPEDLCSKLLSISV